MLFDSELSYLIICILARLCSVLVAFFGHLNILDIYIFYKTNSCKNFIYIVMFISVLTQTFNRES